MKTLACFVVLGLLATSFGQTPATQPAKSVLDYTVADAKGQPVELSQYKGKVVMLVNVASKCGHTPQYENLEKVYQEYKDKGFVIVGLPANNFGNQEPGSNEEIQQFCKANYGVTFPVLGKLSTKGDDKAPIYQYLTGKDTNPQFAGEIGWNFTKFLVGKDGQVVARYDSGTKPDTDKVKQDIERELAK